MNGEIKEKIDKRMHIPIKDKRLQKRIKEVMELENLTYEELVEKYLNIPLEDYEIIHQKFQEISKMVQLITHYRNKHESEIVMDCLWVLIMQMIKANIDAEKVIQTISEDIEKGRFK